MVDQNWSYKEVSYLYPNELSIIAGVRPAIWIWYEKGPTEEWINKKFSFQVPELLIE